MSETKLKEEEEEIKPALLVQGWVPPDLDREFTVVGKPLNRIDGPEKATGRAQYAGDIKLPGMLYAKILRSPYAHARIKSIDTSEAEKLPGVKAILTKDNTPGWYTYWYRVPQPAFPDIVSYVGHEIAAIAAEDIDTARRAMELIKVEYEILPAVFDAEEAMKPGAVEVTVGDLPNPAPDSYGPVEMHSKNIWAGKPAILSRGDIQKGFREADFVLERVYKTGFQHHGTLQTRTCVANWSGDSLIVFESCQGIWQSKKDLAWSLKLPPEKVTIKMRYEGGGFGSKAGAHRSIHYASRLSMVTKRPVRLELTRAEEFLAHPRRASCSFYIKTGVKRDGTLTAMYGKAILNIGAGGGYRPFTNRVIGMPFVLYKCPNAYFEQWGVHTNLQFNGPMRSPVNLMGVCAAEAHFDEVAETVGIDPLDFRIKNYTPYADQVRHIPFSSKKLDVAMSSVTKAIDWSKWKEYGSKPWGSSKRRGVGMANYIFHGVGNNPSVAFAEVSLRNDGSIDLRIGITDIGGGSATALSQVAAEELGVELRDIHVVYGDTAPTPFGPGSHSSRVIPEVAPAVLQAAAIARKNLFQIVGTYMRVDPSDLRSKLGEIYLASDPAIKMNFKDACALIGPEGILAKGSRAPAPGSHPFPHPKPEGGGWSPPHGPVQFATFGSCAVEVEVDVETGEVRVLRAAIAHEFGRALNPKFCDSQLYGGISMGIGSALLEEAITDSKTGIMMNTDLHQYRMATSLDMPLECIPFNIEGEDKFFAYSAKGGAEGTNTSVPAAIRNAIYNATGVWMYEYPITPNRLLVALSKKKKDATVNRLEEKELLVR